MTFGEKLKKARKEKGITQAQLGKLAGININTICNYEKGKTYPQNRKVYSDLAEILGVDVNYLKSENEEFILSAAEQYGYKGRIEAQQFIQSGTCLFAGGELSQEEKDNVMLELQKIYWKCKEDNNNKK